MSQCHCELVIPPPPVPIAREGDPWADRQVRQYVRDAFEEVMLPFCTEAPRRVRRPDAFHDGCRIGGGFAGRKLIARCDPDRLQSFRYWLFTQKGAIANAANHYTDLTDPVAQQQLDDRWNEMFPFGPPMRCPLFAYARRSSGFGMSAVLPGDVMRLADLPRSLTCYLVVLAAPACNAGTGQREGPLETVFTVGDEHWGHPPGSDPAVYGAWNHTVSGALSLYQLISQPGDAGAAACLPADDWLTVTVTCHC